MSPNNFGLTPELLTALRKEEGWVPKPYICPAGYPTIGYGHRIPSMNHPSITEEYGEMLLLSDARFARDVALRHSPNLAAEPERRTAAIVDFIFNLGGGNYSSSTLKKCVDRGDWKEAAAQLQRWVFATDPKTGKKFKMAGLISRRARAGLWMYNPVIDDQEDGA